MTDQLLQTVRERLGVQAYCLRNDMDVDLREAFTYLKTIGYNQVELFSLHGHTAEQVSGVLKDIDLRPTGMHIRPASLRDNLPQMISDLKTLGIPRVGIAWIKRPGETMITLEEVKETIDIFRAIEPRCKDAGIQLYYHVHGYEFRPYQTGTLFDHLLAGIEDLDIELQLDIFWAVYSGQDPIALMNRLGKKITMLHLKDMKPETLGDVTGSSPHANFEAVGHGVIDYRSILAKAVELDVQHYYVEDESPEARVQLARSLEMFDL